MYHLFIRQLAYWIIHLKAWDDGFRKSYKRLIQTFRTTKAEKHKKASKLAHLLRLTALSVQTLLMTNV